MNSASRSIIAITGLLLILISAIPLSASAQISQFKNDIFSKTWWMTQPSKFVNDVFNPTWWKTQPAKFVNDIFNPEWLSQKPAKFANDIFNRYWPAVKQSKFVNDIFNSGWFADQQSKFLNDIFRKQSADDIINAVKSSLGTGQSGSAQPAASGSSKGECFDRYGTVCYDSCGHTLECVKGCSIQFSACIRGK